MFPAAHGVVSQGRKRGAPGPGPGDGKYRYYRLLFYENNGGNFVGTNTFALRETVGGPDTVQGSGGTPSATASSETQPASQAFNGNTSNGWGVSLASAPFPNWLQWDFGPGNEKAITEYVVGAYGTSTDTADRSPRAWAFQASNDGNDWVTLDMRYAEGSWTLTETRAYQPSAAEGLKHYRLVVTATQGGTSLAIAEIRLHSAAGGPNVAIGGIVTESEFSAGRVGALAFDNNQSTFWNVSGFSGSAWVAYELLMPAEIVEYAIQKYFNNNNTAPSAWQLQSSGDGLNWTTIASESGVVWDGPNYETKVFSV